jgi:hypothetical protein
MSIETRMAYMLTSELVWLLKGRDYMIPKGPNSIDGSNWKKA